MFVIDGHRIHRRDSRGKVRAVAGSGAAGDCGDGGPALEACLNPVAVVHDPADRALYVSTYDPPAVRRIDAQGRIATLSTDFESAEALALDHRGGLYVVESGRHSGISGVVRHLAADGHLRTVAGQRGCTWRTGDPVLPPLGDGGPATGACLFPSALAVGRDGTLYIADNRAARVRAVDGAGVISTVAGNGLAPAGRISVCPSEGPAGCLGYPTHLALASDGSVYVAARAAAGEGDNYFEHGAIYRIGRGLGVVRVTGRPVEGPTGNICPAADPGPALLTCFGYIDGMVVDDAGRVLFTSSAFRPWEGGLRLSVVIPGGTGLI